MTTKTRTTRTLTATEAKRQFGTLLDDVIAGQLLRITRHKRVRVVMIPAEDFEYFQALEDQADVVVAKARRKASKGKTIPHSEVKRQLGLND